MVLGLCFAMFVCAALVSPIASAPAVYETFYGDSVSQTRFLLFDETAADSVLAGTEEGVAFRERRREITARFSAITGTPIRLFVLRVENHAESRAAFWLERDAIHLALRRGSGRHHCEVGPTYDVMQSFPGYFPRRLSLQPGRAAYTLVAFPQFTPMPGDSLSLFVGRLKFQPVAR